MYKFAEWHLDELGFYCIKYTWCHYFNMILVELFMPWETIGRNVKSLEIVRFLFYLSLLITISNDGYKYWVGQKVHYFFSVK